MSLFSGRPAGPYICICFVGRTRVLDPLAHVQFSQCDSESHTHRHAFFTWTGTYQRGRIDVSERVQYATIKVTNWFSSGYNRVHWDLIADWLRDLWRWWWCQVRRWARQVKYIQLHQSCIDHHRTCSMNDWLISSIHDYNIAWMINCHNSSPRRWSNNEPCGALGFFAPFNKPSERLICAWHGS